MKGKVIYMTKNLYDDNLNEVSGGQQCANNVMGVAGLNAYIDDPTVNNPEGVFFKKRGIYLNQQETMDLLKKHATRDLDPETEGFIESYIASYNSRNMGDGIVSGDKG